MSCIVYLCLTNAVVVAVFSRRVSMDEWYVVMFLGVYFRLSCSVLGGKKRRSVVPSWYFPANGYLEAGAAM